MKPSRNILVLSAVICAGVLAGKHAQAGGFKFGGGSGNGGGSSHSFKINHGGNNSSHNQFKNGSSFKKIWNKNDHHDDHHNDHHDHHGHHHHHHHKHYPHKYHVRYAEPVRYVYTKCYYPPFHSCYVYPGDTWYTISKRIYGVDYMCKHIASYNGLTMGSPLTAGQMLRLPVINQNGSLTASSAPMPAPFSLPAAGAPTQGAPFGPQGLPNGSTVGTIGPRGLQTASLATSGPTVGQPEGPSAPAANIRTVTNEPALPRVAIGSTLALDGESLGSEKGIVRLRVSGLALPVDVIEWSETSVKIQLPKMDLSNPVKAELEVTRADGSLASKSGIELTPAATRLALGK